MSGRILVGALLAAGLLVAGGAWWIRTSLRLDVAGRVVRPGGEGGLPAGSRGETGLAAGGADRPAAAPRP